MTYEDVTPIFPDLIIQQQKRWGSHVKRFVQTHIIKGCLHVARFPWVSHYPGLELTVLSNRWLIHGGSYRVLIGFIVACEYECFTPLLYGKGVFRIKGKGRGKISMK